MGSFKLVWRNLTRRKLRSLLTILSIAVAIFLICSLRTLITTINAGVQAADNRRLAVMSSTGLFAELPMKYQAAIARVPGVEMTTKFQWFGGYFRSQKNFFAQFAVDPDTLFEMYPECKTPLEQQKAFIANRTSAIVGDSIAEDLGWKVGDTVPIIGALHPHPEGTAWEFQIAGIYHSDVPNFDNRTMFFHWDYYEETLKAGGVTPGVGVFSMRVAPGTDVSAVIAQVEDAFRDSEQLVTCQTEAEFQRQFVTMFGNIPLFVGWIGGGVVLAILLASVNTMLMSVREQTTDIGIMKSLGFTDGSMFGQLIAQALVLTAVGGGVGLVLAWASQASIATWMAAFFPGYVITANTFWIAVAITLGIGLAAGIVPAWRARNLRCVEAMRGMD
ncbi:MAG: ABC transporter permease [Planctomycetota bacterium]